MFSILKLHLHILCSCADVYKFLLCDVCPCSLGAATLNLALNKPAYQTSLRNSRGQAGNAVDGNPDGRYFIESCTHTNYSNMPWWVVDLGSDMKVSHVQISNRLEGESR